MCECDRCKNAPIERNIKNIHCEFCECKWCVCDEIRKLNKYNDKYLLVPHWDNPCMGTCIVCSKWTSDNLENGLSKIEVHIKGGYSMYYDKLLEMDEKVLSELKEGEIYDPCEVTKRVHDKSRILP